MAPLSFRFWLGCCRYCQLYTGIGFPAAVQFKLSSVSAGTSTVSFAGQGKVGGSEDAQNSKMNQYGDGKNAAESCRLDGGAC